jgi:dipeptidyl aminopeptidase/acylaminoacyl peptidase
MTRTARALTSALTVAALLLAVPLLSAPPASAAFLGKRAVIAVSVLRSDGRTHDVWLMAGTGAGQMAKLQNLTLGRVANALDPTFSPEGGPHIAFVSGGDIYVIDRDSPGNGPSTIFHLTGDSDPEYSPSWSPSGGKLTYVRERPNAAPQIWTMSLSGDNQAALTCCRPNLSLGTNPILGTEPAWSPDSNYIAYVQQDRTGAKKIWVARVDGRAPPVFVVAGDQPNWSPLQDAMTYIDPSGEVYTIPLKTVPVIVPGVPTLVDRNTADRNPAWSPDDGGIITFDRGDGRIYSVNPKVPLTSTTLFSKAGFHADHADWQPECNIEGNDFANTLTGTSKSELICGKKGPDTIRGGGGSDRIFAGEGADKVWGGGGDDFVLGGQGGDSNYINGGPGNDHLEGGIGNDILVDTAKGGTDEIQGQAGNDAIRGNDGDRANGDNIDGGLGNDSCATDVGIGPGLQPPFDFVFSCESALRIRLVLIGG